MINNYAINTNGIYLYDTADNAQIIENIIINDISKLSLYLDLFTDGITLSSNIIYGAVQIDCRDETTITNNFFNMQAGVVDIAGWKINILNNTVIGGGIASDSVAYWYSYTYKSANINNNNIFNSKVAYNLQNGSSIDINGENNYWNTTNESEIQTRIYDWFEDSNLGKVNYAPFLTSPSPDSPISPPQNVAVNIVSGSDAQITWDANPESDLAGYKVYYDTDSGYPYENVIDPGDVTTCTLPDLQDNVYIAVAAYDTDYDPANDDPNTIVDENITSGHLSWFSAETYAIKPLPPVVASVTITGASPTNAATVDFILTFSKPVTGVDLSDFTIDASGVTDSLVSSVNGSGTTWTVTVSTGTGDGMLSIDVTDNDSITDMASNPLGGNGVGNGNYTSGESYIIDKTSPTVVLSSTTSDPTNVSPIPVTVTFNESVTGFTVEDITVSNGSDDNFTGSGADYTFNLIPAGQGIVSVSISADKAVDSAGNGNDASNQLTRTYVTVQPAVQSVTRMDDSPTSAETVRYAVDFTEPVSGVDLSDFTVYVTDIAGPSLAGISGSGASYIVTVNTGAGDGVLRLDVIDDHTIMDGAGNALDDGYTAGETYTIYKTAPSVVLTTTAPVRTNSSPMPVAITFSEPVTGFTIDDVVITNGTPSNFIGSDASYTVDISPAGEGVVTIGVDPGIVVNSLQTANTASNVLSLTYDTTPPVVLSIVLADNNPNNSQTVRFTVTFSEAVTGVDLTDFVFDVSGVIGAFVSGIEGSENTYTVTVSTGSGDGTFGINVSDDDSITDAASNPLGGAGTGNGDYSAGQRYTIDKTPPVAILNNLPQNPTNSISASITVSGDEVTAYKWRLDGSGWSDSTLVSNPIDLNGISEGEHTLEVVGGDAIGNWQSESFPTVATWTVDNSTVVTIDDGDQCSLSTDINLTGTREDGSVISVSCDGVAVGSVFYPENTRWRVDLNGLLPGENIVNVQAVDLLGNQSTASVTISHFVPAQAEVQVGSGELLADGVSTLAMSATISDDLENRVCPGTPITVSTDLGQIVPAEYLTDANGQIVFDLQASSELGTATITVAYNGDAIGTGSVAMIAGPIDRLVITTPPQTIYVGPQTSSRIFVESRDASGHAVNVENDILVYLSSHSEVSSEFSTIENGLQWQQGGAMMRIYAGTSSAFFKFRDSQAGTWTLKAEESPDRGLIDAEQQISVINIPDVIVQLQGVPDEYEGFSGLTDAEIIISGAEVIAYKYRLDGNVWHERSVDTHIALTGLAEGLHTIEVCGKNQFNIWQSDDNPTSATWTVDVSGPQTSAGLVGGAYPTQQSIGLECSDGNGCGCEMVYYTTDGSMPTTASDVYDSSISIEADTTLRFFGVDHLGNVGEIEAVDYVIDSTSPGDIRITNPEDGAWAKPYFIEGMSTDAESGILKVEIQLSINDDGVKYLNAANNFTPVATWIPAQLLADDIWQYYLNPQWRDGKQYRLSARATDMAGNTSTQTITFYYGDALIPSVVSCSVSATDVTIGDEVVVSGKIEPGPAINTPVSVGLVSPIVGSQPLYFNAHTNLVGEFSLDLIEGNPVIPCTALTQAGQWSVFTRWEGDTSYSGARSEDVVLTVSKADTSIDLSTSSKSIKIGDTINISGKISSYPDCGNGRMGLPIKITITGPPLTAGGAPVSNSIEIATIDKFGHFALEDYTGFDHLGAWSVKAEFTQNSAYMSSQSDTLPVGVLETAGYAIIVEGKISNGEGLDSHNKTTRLVHDIFEERGLTDDDIKYFNYDLSENGADAAPTQAGIQNAVTSWARDKMNEKPANLYIVMVDHGKKDQFYIDQGKDINDDDLESITPGEMAAWLDALQSGLNEQAENQQIIVVLGFCHSGSFIDELQGEHRIIISSANTEELSYKGPQDDDGIRGGEYFVDQFFENARTGLSVAQCYEVGRTNTEQYTKSNKKNVNANYYEPTEQHPQIANRDLALATYIGVSSLSGNAPGDVSIIEQSDSVFLDFAENSTDLWARVDDSERLLNIWIEIKQPGFAPDIGTGEARTEQLEMDLYRQAGQYNPDTDRYEWNSLAIFDDPGAYQVMYFAKDAITHNLSQIHETMVYKAKAENQPPLDFNLVEPVEDRVISTQVAQLAFYWNETSDPDGDALTYTLMLSDNASDFSSATVVSGIESNFYLFDGLEDLHTYYWKIRAIDQYGAFTESPVESFFTNYTNAVQGWISGRIYNYITGAVINGATIRLHTGDLDQMFRSGTKGYFLGTSDPGTYTVKVTASGFATNTLADFEVPAGERVVKDIALQPTQIGDLDGDTQVRLSDAVIAWQALAGLDVSGKLRSDYTTSNVDVDGDDKVGIAEGLYILRKISGN